MAKRKKLKKHIYESAQRKGKIAFLSDLGDKYSEQNKSKHTNDSVRKVASILDSIGIKYETEKKVVIKYSSILEDSKLYLLDFYLPPPFNFVIEVDGGYHSTPEQKKYDSIRDRIVRSKGLGYTARFTNEQVLKSDFDLFDSLPIKIKPLMNAILDIIKNPGIVDDISCNEEIRQNLNLWRNFVKKSNRVKTFENVWTPILNKVYSPGIFYNRNRMTFSLRTATKKGTKCHFSYYPTADKIRTDSFKGVWIENGLEWIIYNFLK